MLSAVALLAAAPAQAPSISVAEFLAKTDALQKKGMLAVFSSDLRVIKAVAKADIDAFDNELLAAVRSHRPLPACLPKEGQNFKFTVNSDELLGYYRSIPQQRRGISSRQAFAEFMSRKYPCHG